MAHCLYPIFSACGLRSSWVITFATVAMLFGASGAFAQAVDVAGTWDLSVDVQGSVTTPSVVLDQEGDSLSGHYSSDVLGEADVTGRVSGSDVTFSLDSPDLGISVRYALALAEDGTLSGTIYLEGQAAGSVVGRRSSG